MTPLDIAKEVFPDGNEALWDHLIWARTGFPGFFALKEGQTVEDRMREQLIEFKGVLDRQPKGMGICDHCNSYIRKGAWHCWRCDWNRVFDESEV